MSHLPPLIADLALILICAGAMTLLFKWMKQPLVLGYIVAGFIASPHMPYMPSVADVDDIKVWADIGVIFLLFALGMEFSLKKMIQNGSTAIVAALLIITCMMSLGCFTGFLFGWPAMDCIYLGGMMAMSSTTIIYKAFDDLSLRRKPFAVLVISVLVVEDILAVVMMVLLSTVAASRNFEGGQLVMSILSLVFYLVLWFVVGIFVVPTLMKRLKKWMGDETMLIVSLALCFAMVVIASQAGFSPAFGAFIMGSILAETVEVERIEHLVSPVKDLFGAIFFVSVGMMVDVNMIVQYWLPILVISLAIVLGQCIFGSFSFVVAGQPLRSAMRCGFSLTQIGEFAFIIASLGTGLGVTSDFLYPIVVLVSVITTFVSPYMIRAAVPASAAVERMLPARWRQLIKQHTTGHATVTLNDSRRWRSLMTCYAGIVVLFSVLCTAVLLLSFHLLEPLLRDLMGDLLPAWGSDLISVLLMSGLLFPFLYALVIKQPHRKETSDFLHKNRYYRATLMGIALLRLLLAMLFVFVLANHFFHFAAALAIALLLAVCFVFSLSHTRRVFSKLEGIFIDNFTSRERQMAAEKQASGAAPQYAKELPHRELTMMEFVVPRESAWAGRSLKELNFGRRYGVHVASLLRGSYRVNTPGGNAHLFPDDHIQVIGSEEQLRNFGNALQKELIKLDETNSLEREMVLQPYLLEEGSPFIGKTLADSGLRDIYGCLLVELDRAEQPQPLNSATLLAQGDVLWLLAENKNFRALKALG